MSISTFDDSAIVRPLPPKSKPARPGGMPSLVTQTKLGGPGRESSMPLCQRHWERDGRLGEVATELRGVLGDVLFDDHNIFRIHVNAVLKKSHIKVPSADLKQILKE
jgi:hypothetical protein